MKFFIEKTDLPMPYRSLTFFPKYFKEMTGRDILYTDVPRESEGKPQDIDGIHFNISHSGDYWCVAFSKREVGVDIEVLRDVPDRLREKILCDGEEPLEVASSEFYNLGLLKTWVLKEAYVKYKGTGVSLGLSTVSIDQIYEECEVTDFSGDGYFCFVVQGKL